MKNRHSYPDQHARMTEMPIPQLAISLAGPGVVSMLTTTVYNMVDTWFVSRLGTLAVAAVGICFSITSFVNAVGYLFGMGSGTCIGMLLGARKNDEADRLASTAFFSTIVLGLIVMTLGLTFAEPMVRFLGSSDAVLPYAKDYAVWMMVAFPVMTASLVLSTILRCEGKLNLSMTGIASGAVLNMVLDPLFIFVFNMGVAGAAIATALSQAVGFLILLSYYISGKTETHLSLKKLSVHVSTYRQFLVTGTPSLCRHLVNTVANIALNVVAGSFGGDVLIAALSIVNKVTTVIQAVIKGVYQGAQAIYSYNKGAGRYDRVEQAFRFTLGFNTVLIMAVAVFMTFAARAVMGLFDAGEESVIVTGTYALIVQTWALLPMPLNFSGNTLLQSVGEPMKSTFLALLPQGLLYVPALFILPMLLGLNGVIWAPLAGQLLTIPLTVIMVKQFFSSRVVNNQNAQA